MVMDLNYNLTHQHQRHHHQYRQPLHQIQPPSSNSTHISEKMLAPPHTTSSSSASSSNQATTIVPRVTVTTSPLANNINGDKLPTLTTPPQTVTRSMSNSGLRSDQVQDSDTSFSIDKIAKSKRLKKSHKLSDIAPGDSLLSSLGDPTTATLLSPAFSSPPNKAEKSNSLPLPPKLPKFVQSNVTKIKASSKKEKTQEDIDELNRQVPPPELMPKVIDTSTDFTKKPLYSYAMLIGMSILRLPNRRLTLSQIYNWISDTFRYYKKGDVGWQNSVRHNLSLNKLFVKSARSKDRKGHFWHIAKGYEYQFYLGKGALPQHTPLQLQQLQLQQQQLQQQLLLLLLQEEKDAASAEDYEEEDEEDETVKIVLETPRSKIIKRHYDDMIVEDSSSALLQKFMRDNNRTHEDLHLQPPVKKRFTASSLAGAGGHLHSDSIPNLQPPSPSWAASASGDRVIFGLLKTPPKMTLANSSLSHVTSQSSIFDSPLPIQHQTHPSSVQQGNRYQQFTSSFSCISNFDLSPIKGTETGPLLEPLTPAQGLSMNNNNNNTHSGGNGLGSHTLGHSKNGSNAANTLLGNMVNSSGTMMNSLNATPSILKTPFNKNNLTTMKTPGSSVMKKIWNSPSYLDDFYTSPVVNKRIQFEEEDIVVSSARDFGSPAKDKKSRQL